MHFAKELRRYLEGIVLCCVRFKHVLNVLERACFFVCVMCKCADRAGKQMGSNRTVVSARVICKRRSESERVAEIRRRGGGGGEVGGRKKSRLCKRWENRARGGGDEESKIEELPPRHSSILPL